MKNIIKIVLFALIIMGVITLCLTYKSGNDITENKQQKHNNLAIMIKEDGASDYTKSSSKDIPIGDYTLNYGKSYCKNNGVIGDYDNTLGKVSFSFIGTDSCYLYFDYNSGPTFSDVVKVTPNLISSQDGTKYEIVDEYGIRYEGKDPDNYVCFLKDEDKNCEPDALYRIIGKFNEKIGINDETAIEQNVIKLVSSKAFNDETAPYNSDGTNNWETSDTFYYLNNNFLNNTLFGTAFFGENLNVNLENKILNAKWYFGGTQIASGELTTYKSYTLERTKHYIDNPLYVYAKIGLINLSDFGFSVLIDYCDKTTVDVTEYGGSSLDCGEQNWLQMKNAWTLDTDSSTYNVAFCFEEPGIPEVSLTETSRNIYPTFYISALEKIASGDGSLNNPYIIAE